MLLPISSTAPCTRPATRCFSSIARLYTAQNSISNTAAAAKDGSSAKDAECDNPREELRAEAIEFLRAADLRELQILQRKTEVIIQIAREYKTRFATQPSLVSLISPTTSPWKSKSFPPIPPYIGSERRRMNESIAQNAEMTIEQGRLVQAHCQDLENEPWNSELIDKPDERRAQFATEEAYRLHLELNESTLKKDYERQLAIWEQDVDVYSAKEGTSPDEEADNATFDPVEADEFEDPGLSRGTIEDAVKRAELGDSGWDDIAR
ncbi:hypothetical protein H2203_000614 [Taxawa tesnikishii (nom. ined.)]|nr:hypothetical protein H2203_000614 [Dothideales sp. JES 119]